MSVNKRIVNHGFPNINIRNRAHIGSHQIRISNLDCIPEHETLNDFICDTYALDLQDAYDNGDGIIILDPVIGKPVNISNNAGNTHENLLQITNNNGTQNHLTVGKNYFIAQKGKISATGGNNVSIGENALVEDSLIDPTLESMAIGQLATCQDSYSTVIGNNCRILNTSLTQTCEANVILGYDMEIKCDATATKVADYNIALGIGTPGQPALLNTEHSHYFGRSEVGNKVQDDHINSVGHFISTDGNNNFYNYLRGCNIGLENNCHNVIIDAVNYDPATTRTSAGNSATGVNPSYTAMIDCDDCNMHGNNNNTNISTFCSVFGHNNLVDNCNNTTIIGTFNRPTSSDNSFTIGHNNVIGNVIPGFPNYAGCVGSNIENYADNSIAFSSKSGTVNNPAIASNQASFFFPNGINLLEDSNDLPNSHGDGAVNFHTGAFPITVALGGDINYDLSFLHNPLLDFNFTVKLNCNVMPDGSVVDQCGSLVEIWISFVNVNGVNSLTIDQDRHIDTTLPPFTQYDQVIAASTGGFNQFNIHWPPQGVTTWWVKYKVEAIFSHVDT